MCFFIKSTLMKRLSLLFLFTCLSVIISAQTLMLYGGKNHDIFLGRLNGPKQSKESIWNPNCIYGNATHNYSIWNKWGTFGAKNNVFSPFNCNTYYPPGIYDENGNFYGYFTCSDKVENVCYMPLLNIITSNIEYIRDNVSEAYDQLEIWKYPNGYRIYEGY